MSNHSHPVETDFNGTVHDSDGDPVHTVVRLKNGAVIYSLDPNDTPDYTARNAAGRWGLYASEGLQDAIEAWEATLKDGTP